MAGVSTAFVERASVVLLEGYLWDVASAKEAMRYAAAIAHDVDGSVALSLSDPFCVARHQREFLDLLVDDIDILLGNEEEITMLFGAASHKAALEAAEETGLLVVMTCWALAGCAVLTRPRPRRGGGGAGRPGRSTPPVPGTFFAAGVLYGLTHGMDPVQSAPPGRRLRRRDHLPYRRPSRIRLAGPCRRGRRAPPVPSRK